MITVLLALAVWPVLADDIEGPPEECPPGTQGDSDHAGPYCTPVRCASSSECAAGFECAEISLCARNARVSGGIDGTSWDRVEVYGTCGGGAACSDGECTAIRACVPPGTSPMVEPSMDAPPTAMTTTSQTTTEEADESCAVVTPSFAVAIGIIALLIARPRRTRDKSVLKR
jgi:hypothetical protein